SKTLILRSSDSANLSYIWFLDIWNKKVLRKIKCDTLSYDYLQYDHRGKRYYFFLRDDQGKKWIATTDSTLSNPKKLLNVDNVDGPWVIGSFFDTAYQRYFFPTRQPKDN